MIDPLRPDFLNTPAHPGRPPFGYAPENPGTAPHVTVVTPFFNTGAEFHETARSVFGQSFQQWEWLIVNDGSTDPKSLSVLSGYRRGPDPRVQVIDHGNNRGLSAARNTGFRAARARYVVQLDSDDLLEPTAVEKWLWFLKSHPGYGFAKGYTVGFGGQQYLWDKGFHLGRAFLHDNLVDATGMIRRDVYDAAGGYDEVTRRGLEDWDFWLRCAHAGYWGGTVPEYHDWYRRRASHTDRWEDLHADRISDFRRVLRQRYARLWEPGAFPEVRTQHTMPYEMVPDDVPCSNRLSKRKPRALMVLPWLTLGGADKFNLDLVSQLTRWGWEVTIATTLAGDHSWMPQFTRYTPDVFAMAHFLRPPDYPTFLRYLIESRQPDVVLVSNSELGYLLLPYLRARCPEVTFLDYCHMEEEHWKNGGHPRAAVQYQELLDLNVVSSQHLRQWMCARGADPRRVEVCHTNINAGEWKPDAKARRTVRREFGWDDRLAVILYAGRLVAQKQPRVFAQTMLRLAKAGLPFVAAVAGAGPELPWLQAFVRDNRLDERVRLLGPVPNDRLLRLMQASDVFFLPSEWEGISLAIYEAMATGLAVVGADVGGQRELVTSDCGVLVGRADETSEADRYAAALAPLIRKPASRRAMGRAARTRVESHFRLDQMGERMNALLYEARRRHDTQPRPPVAVGLGLACAVQAVEYTRLFELADQLWAKCATAGRPSDASQSTAVGMKPASKPATVRRYGMLIQAVRRAVKRSTPAGSTVLVISKGDEQLLKLDGRRGWHFPRAADGQYAGHYPADSVAAVVHLESLRDQGAQYLLFPQPSLWWLEHYAGLRQHLDMEYRRVDCGRAGIMYDLAAARSSRGLTGRKGRVIGAKGARARSARVNGKTSAATPAPVSRRRSVAAKVARG